MKKIINKKKKGFTIIELLAAIVIIGIILSIAIIAINKYILQGHNAVDSQIEKQLILGAKSYFSDNKTKFITDSDTGVVIWYTTLKANDYISNDLVDSDGNSCSKSYVVVKKDGSKYTYSGCVICDNGYNNTSDKKECSESLANNIYCEWYDGNTKLNENTKIYMGTKKNNEKEFTLKCKGKGIKFKNPKNKSYLNDIKRLVSDMFDVENGNISINEDFESKSTKSGIASFTQKVKYTATSDGNGSITFKTGSGYVLNKNQEVYNEDISYKGMIIDGKGPVCTLSGAYKDIKLTNTVKAVKSGTTVYYKLECKDDNNVNGTISTDGFKTSDSISEINIVSRPKNEVKEKSAVISVKVTKGSTSKLSLIYLKDKLYDNYDNGNNEATATANGGTLVIDDNPPTCTFNGPAYNATFNAKKSKMDVSQSNEYAYYELRCTDENGIDANTFKFSDITSYEFGKIEQSGNMQEIKDNEGNIIGYRYIIVVYKKNVTSLDKPVDAYLTYNSSNLKDTIGNSSSNNYKSQTIKMIDSTKIPTCSISTSDSNGYVILNGSMSTDTNLKGYAWSTDTGTPSNYTSISGTNRTASTNAYVSGVYYLHMIDENDLTGYCQTADYVYIPIPDTPKLLATDGESSGSWHKSDFSLYASSSSGNVTYYYGSNSYNVSSTSSPYVSSETSGTTYYARACWRNNLQVCSPSAQYLALLDKTPPVCNVSMTKTGTCSARGGEYTGGWTQCNVEANVSNCYDNLSGMATYSSYNNKYSSEGISSIYASSIKDNAGNYYYNKDAIKIDTTAPSSTLECSGSSCTFSCSDSNGISCIKLVYGEQYTDVSTGGSCVPEDYTNKDKTSLTITIPYSYRNTKATVVGECTDYARNGSTKSKYNYDAYPSTITCTLSVTNQNGKEIYSSSSQKLSVRGSCSSDNSTMAGVYLSGGGTITNYNYYSSYATGTIEAGQNKTVTITVWGSDLKGTSGGNVSRIITLK